MFDCPCGYKYVTTDCRELQINKVAHGKVCKGSDIKIPLTSTLGPTQDCRVPFYTYRRSNINRFL